MRLTIRPIYNLEAALNPDLVIRGMFAPTFEHKFIADELWWCEFGVPKRVVAKCLRCDFDDAPFTEPRMAESRPGTQCDEDE